MKKKIIYIMVLLLLGMHTVKGITTEEVMYDKDGNQEKLTETIEDLKDAIEDYKSSGSVTEEKMLSGKTAYVKGILVEGSMPNIGGINRTLNPGEEIRIGKGYTSGGTVSTQPLSVLTQVEAGVLSDKMVSGYQCYVNGEKITGTIPKKEETTYTPGTSDQTIASGQYLDGNQVILGDEDLIAENIKTGVDIFGVTGNYGGVYNWSNTSNGSYKFVQNGARWKSNNVGKSSSIAESTWTVTIPVKKTYTIYYRVSSELLNDKFTIILNGEVIVNEVTGNSDIIEKEVELRAGENTLTARYEKNGSINSYEDCAYIFLEAVKDGETANPKTYAMGNATEGDILEGKTAYTNNGMVVGSMPNYSTSTKTMGSSDVRISGDYIYIKIPESGCYSYGSTIRTSMDNIPKRNVKVGTFTTSTSKVTIDCGFKPKYIYMYLYTSTKTVLSVYNEDYSTEYYFQVTAASTATRAALKTESTFTGNGFYVSSTGFIRAVSSSYAGLTMHYFCAD